MRTFMRLKVESEVGKTMHDGAAAGIYKNCKQVFKHNYPANHSGTKPHHLAE
jgi:hypothetical protein